LEEFAQGKGGNAKERYDLSKAGYGAYSREEVRIGNGDI